jgi:hypothetical protein
MINRPMIKKRGKVIFAKNLKKKTRHNVCFIKISEGLHDRTKFFLHKEFLYWNEHFSEHSTFIVYISVKTFLW